MSGSEEDMAGFSLWSTSGPANGPQPAPSRHGSVRNSERANVALESYGLASSAADVDDNGVPFVRNFRFTRIGN